MAIKDKEKIERLLAQASASSYIDTQYLLDIDRELLRRIRDLEAELKELKSQDPLAKFATILRKVIGTGPLPHPPARPRKKKSPYDASAHWSRRRRK